MRPDESVYFERFCLSPAQRLLYKDGSPVTISSRALDLLIALTDKAGTIVGARELIELVWPHAVVEEGNLRVQIAALRKALGDGTDGARFILTVAGRGYAFVARVQRSMRHDEPQIVALPEQIALPDLPALPKFLVGRKEAIDVLILQLLSQRFVSIVGPGGIGKTTVAVAVAHALGKDFGADSVYFVDLGPVNESAFVLSAITSGLRCPIQGADPESYLRNFLASKRMLIVLDSCEHLIEDIAPLVERLFSDAPLVYLLTTSREALRIAEENVHLLSPLSSPIYDTPSAAQALASPAVQLFMERARKSGYHSPLSEADAPLVAEICRRLDGIALAIELAASRVGTYGIRGTADLLSNGPELFLLRGRGTPPRHQTLQATLDWSFRLLTSSEQRVLCLLSVFVGQFTLESAHAVASDPDIEPRVVVNSVASLTDKSLVSVSSVGGQVHFRLLDMTRSYAAMKLHESDGYKAASKRHASHFATSLAAVAAEGSAWNGRNLATHAFEIGDIRKALAYCFSDSGEYPAGIRLAASAAQLLLGLSLLDECQKWCRRALDALDVNDQGSLLELELQAALASSSMFIGGNNQEIRSALERGLEIAVRLGHRRHQLHLLLTLYIFLTRLGDVKGALIAVKQSAAIVHARALPNENAMTEWMLGAAYHLAGDQAEALRHCQLGFRLKSGLGPGPSEFFGYDYNARGLTALAKSLWLCGFPDRACEVVHHGIDEVETFEHPVSYCVFLLFSVPVLLWSGVFEAAIEPIERAIRKTIKYSLSPYHAVGIALRGELMIARGNPDGGVAILRDALKAMDASRYHIMRLEPLRALAGGLVLCGQPDEALDTIDEALARAGEGGGALWLPDLLRARGEILMAQPKMDVAAAEADLTRAIDAARKQSALSWELKAALPLARLLQTQGRGEEAHSLLDEIYKRFTEGFETRDLVVGRRLLMELSSPQKR